MTGPVRVFAQTRAERDRVARNIAEVIDALYREGAAPRDRERLVDLVRAQVSRAMWLGKRMCPTRQADEDD